MDWSHPSQARVIFIQIQSNLVNMTLYPTPSPSMSCVGNQPNFFSLSKRLIVYSRLIASKLTALAKAMAPLHFSLSASLGKGYRPLGWLLHIPYGSLNPLSRLWLTSTFTWLFARTQCSQPICLSLRSLPTQPLAGSSQHLLFFFYWLMLSVSTPSG